MKCENLLGRLLLARTRMSDQSSPMLVLNCPVWLLTDLLGLKLATWPLYWPRHTTRVLDIIFKQKTTMITAYYGVQNVTVGVQEAKGYYREDCASKTRRRSHLTPRLQQLASPEGHHKFCGNWSRKARNSPPPLPPV